jgi:flavin reductase (DIM6/NTAB) family NADH-FMN oxidoreductase RutF
MKPLKEISPNDLNESAFRMIGKEWMLITAGTMDSWNTMTASWGGMGEMWFKPAVFAFMRPQRYTLEFVKREPLFTISFFSEKYRPVLEFCGANSGRECDKAAETGLVPFETKNGAVSFEQAHTVIECRKLFMQHLDPEGFIDQSIVDECYPERDFHYMVVGEAQHVLRRICLAVY